MAEERKDEGEDRSGWTSGMGSVAEYSVVGFVFPLALVVGFFVGQWIGELLGGPTMGAVVGVLLGTAVGFYNLWQTLQRLERREAELRAREEVDGDGEDRRGEGGGGA